MPEWVLSCKKPRGNDPSAAIFADGELVFAVEEERLTRDKHAPGAAPTRAVAACLDHCDLALADLDRIVFPDVPRLRGKLLREQVAAARAGAGSLPETLSALEDVAEKQLYFRLGSATRVWADRFLGHLGDLEPVELVARSHHACHAASVRLLDAFGGGMILTADGRGEYDSTVVWDATGGDFERVRTYEYPNSLGTFYGAVTEYLGYRHKNGEGKVMGLAPYGDPNDDVRETLTGFVTPGHDYDVTPLTRGGVEAAVERLEAAFDRERHDDPGSFSQWHRDLAHVTQSLLEETLLAVVEHHLRQFGGGTLGLTGGVALNCKANKRLRESPAVDDLVVQPVAHDGGLALGGGVLGSDAPATDETTVYHGPSFSTEEVVATLEANKIDHAVVDDVERRVAEHLADGAIVGWFQGRLELGPRALGNRSILADPRTEASRDRVNEHVKHREAWRPFAPSMLERAAGEYLVDGGPAPYMIQTFDVQPDEREEIPAVLHPADGTTRPQTVTEEANPRYHRLLEAFEAITGVPVVLNTSFNDHGEPIVATPTEAVKDFYGMGLDVLAMEDVVVEK